MYPGGYAIAYLTHSLTQCSIQVREIEHAHSLEKIRYTCANVVIKAWYTYIDDLKIFYKKVCKKMYKTSDVFL